MNNTELNLKLNQVNIPAEFLDHPYYGAILDWCEERNGKFTGSIDTREDQLLIKLVCEAEDQHLFNVFFRLYESETVYCCITAEIGELDPQTKQKAIDELTELNFENRTFVRLGVDCLDRVVISIRGEISILDRETLKHCLSELLYNAGLFRNVLLKKGISFVPKRKDEGEKSISGDQIEKLGRRIQVQKILNQGNNKQTKPVMGNISEHSFVEAINEWFKSGKHDSDLFKESESVGQISWVVKTNQGNLLRHCLSVNDGGYVEFMSLVILGKISSGELQKMKRLALRYNEDCPSIFKFCLDKDNCLILLVRGRADRVSKEFYKGMLSGLFAWGSATRGILKEDGVLLEPIS